MDERLREKFERLQKDGFLQKKYRIEAISERFEEVLQDFVEGSGMKYEREPGINGKTPDGVIHHSNGRVYIEAVCAQGPDEFNDKKGETDLCRLISPDLIEMNLGVQLSYETTKEDEWGYEITHQAARLEEPMSKRDARLVLERVRTISQGKPDEYDEWAGDVEVRGRELKAMIYKSTNEPGQAHIAHPTCAVTFTKSFSRSGHVSDTYKRDRKRIARKAEKYKKETLDGCPLVIALSTEDTWTMEQAIQVVYGTTYDQIILRDDLETDRMVAVRNQKFLMKDGFWSDRQGRHREHVAAIWIFLSWKTANELPLLAINPFLDHQYIKQAIPKRMRDVSIVCRPTPNRRISAIEST